MALPTVASATTPSLANLVDYFHPTQLGLANNTDVNPLVGVNGTSVAASGHSPKSFTNQVNGLTCIRFNGTSDRLYTPGGLSVKANSVKSYVALVDLTGSAISTECEMGNFGGPSPKIKSYSGSVQTNGNFMFRGYDDSGDINTGYSQFPHMVSVTGARPGMAIIIGRNDGSREIISLNGFSRRLAYSSPSSNAATFEIGCYFGSNFTAYDLYFLALFSTDIGDAESLLWQKYLQAAGGGFKFPNAYVATGDSVIRGRGASVAGAVGPPNNDTAYGYIKPSDNGTGIIAIAIQQLVARGLVSVTADYLANFAIDARPWSGAGGTIAWSDREVLDIACDASLCTHGRFFVAGSLVFNQNAATGSTAAQMKSTYSDAYADIVTGAGGRLLQSTALPFGNDASNATGVTFNGLLVASPRGATVVPWAAQTGASNGLDAGYYWQSGADVDHPMDNLHLSGGTALANLLGGLISPASGRGLNLGMALSL